MRQLTKEECEMLLVCVSLEQKGTQLSPNLEYPFLSQVVKRRIEVMNLPIKFNDAALIAVNAFCSNPGRAVVLLIDCLNKLEGKTVTVDLLCKEVYPFGVYTDEEFEKIVDEKIRTRKMKWSEVY